jgi:phage recombination protein Bet
MNDLTVLNDDLIPVLRSSLYPGASDISIKMVLSYCAAANLDPIQKPVHIVPMWDNKTNSNRDVIMPGVGLYRTIAARSGCAGISEPEFGEDVTEIFGKTSVTYPKWCKVSVSRKLPDGTIAQFTAKEFWKENYATKKEKIKLQNGAQEEYIVPNAMWTKRPYGQIAKCAEAQALRKAFPEVGAQPTAEEMEGKEIDMGKADVVSGQIEPVVHEVQLITLEQIQVISDLMHDNKFNEDDKKLFIEFISSGAISELEKLPAALFSKARAKLEARLARVKNEGGAQ